MKFSLALFVIISLSLQGFTQVRKLYTTAKNELSNDPKTAVFYVLITKVGDSSYLVRQFDMRDTAMVKGSYKDSLMTIPDARFFYYNKYRTTFKTSRYIDTNSWIFFQGNLTILDQG